MYGTALKMEEKSTKTTARSANRSIRRENRTGIPTQLKERMEESTGLSFDDVRVHYNSALPARLDALAYTKGNQVEIGPGQERHLAHELGHVVQQKLGMVRANGMHSSGAPLNTEARLERQADELGAGKSVAVVQRICQSVIQRCSSNDQSPQKKLPPYDKKTTYGIFVWKGGTEVTLKSGDRDPRYTNYANNGHVEQKAALMLRESTETQGRVYHNNPNGTCNYCKSFLPTFLKKDQTLYVVPPSGTEETYVGNESDPKVAKGYNSSK